MAQSNGTRQGTTPIFRWVGGKQILLPKLLMHCPPNSNGRRYFEPFLGAASLFFSIRPIGAQLSDANKHLIDTYKAIRHDAGAVARYLNQIVARDSESNYYSIREDYNRSKPSAKQAARFIYLNRTCFNGVFRVNMRGAFNVPYGHKAAPTFPTLKRLREVADAFQSAELKCCDYEKSLADARKGDFVYLDPPYPPLNGTSFFSHYTMDRFAGNSQAKLAEVVRSLDARGCLVMVSNADTREIRDLYEGFNIRSIPVTRFVTCKAKRTRVHELVITNYDSEAHQR